MQNKVVRRIHGKQRRDEGGEGAARPQSDFDMDASPPSIFPRHGITDNAFDRKASQGESVTSEITQAGQTFSESGKREQDNRRSIKSKGAIS